MLSRVDLNRIKVRLNNISKKVTNHVSFVPSTVEVKMPEYYMSPTMSCLESFDSAYSMDPKNIDLLRDWNIYAYDESVQSYKALEGELLFCSSSMIKMEEKYKFNLSVLPYFLTSMGKYSERQDEDIRYAENIGRARNDILIESKKNLILETVGPHSIVFIDGPLVGGMKSSYMVNMDKELRKNDCIALYFIKNSDSRLIIENDPKLSKEFNSDFHWAACSLKSGHRSAFFRYTDQHNPSNSKVFTYVKPFSSFAERVEMHSETYEKYNSLIPAIFDLLSYLYIAQGDPSNPQVRPIAVAEKYAREGIRVLNIPALLGRLGFRPTINQVRFG
ncbi:MAG: hypothetical protein QW279_01135 [Candidatus Jordarchaeaceae archaeon]